MKLSTHPVRTGQARQRFPGNVDMITGSAFLPAPATGRKAGHPADLPVTGERASAVFGETLWRHLCLSHSRNETPWKRSCTSASPVAHSSKDPPCRGTEKTTLAGSPPMNAYKRCTFEDC